MLKSVKRIGMLTLAFALAFTLALSGFALDETPSEVAAEGLLNMVITIEEEELVLHAGDTASASDIIVPEADINANVIWTADSDKYVSVQPNGYVIARTIVYYEIGPFKIGLPNFGGRTNIRATTLDGSQSVSREVVVKFSFTALSIYIHALIAPQDMPEALYE